MITVHTNNDRSENNKGRVQAITVKEESILLNTFRLNLAEVYPFTIENHLPHALLSGPCNYVINYLKELPVQN